jgi:hypothetical protein
MILKLILLIGLGIIVYKMLGGTFPPLRKIEKEKKSDDFSKNISPTNSCVVCGTYVTESDAIIYKGKTYCSKECLDKGV